MKSWLSKIASPKTIALASLLLGSASLEAKTIYVNELVAGGNKNGTSWANAYQFLRDAVEAAAAGDSIYVAKGTYYPDDGATGVFGDREMAFEFTKAGVAVYGGFAGTETSLSQRNITANPTILSGRIWGVLPAALKDYSSLHVNLVSASTIFDGVTVTGGNANGSLSWTYPRDPFYDQGGAFYVTGGSTLTLRNCTITDNASMEYGGAIMMEAGNGVVAASDTTFSANTVTSFHLSTFNVAGGAVYGNVNATNCKFDANVVTGNPIDSDTAPTTAIARGGAIFGDVTALSCTFSANRAVSSGTENTSSFASGGAIDGDSITLTKCIFTTNGSANVVSYGGAVVGNAINAVNCAFSTNTTTGGYTPNDFIGIGGGGAIYSGGGNSNLTNSVFVSNSSGYRGGAVTMHAPGDNTSSMVIANCTFVDNAAPQTPALGTVTPHLAAGGAALNVQGIVRIVNNVFWNSAATATTLNLINVMKRGVLRNSTGNYPTTSAFAQNLVRNGLASITEQPEGDRFLGADADNIVTGDPAFEVPADFDGVDNLFLTKDDGLRIKSTSAAIGTARTATITYQNFLTKDVQDIDDDGNITESLPADAGGFIRVQNTYVDMGAYENGGALHVGDIRLEVPLGTALPKGTGIVDFGTVLGVGVTKTIFIKNIGVANLTNLVVTMTGANQTDYTITQPFLTKVPAGGSTSFDLTFTPKAEGIRTVSIQVASSDPDDSPYTFNVTGDGKIADIAVEQPVGTNLVDGTAVVNFGDISTNSTSSKTFTIKNTGLGVLSISAINVAGANASDFKAFLPAVKLVNSGASTTFRVDFTPKAVGARSATLSIINNDPDAEGSFDINLTGTATDDPEIKVAQPASSELTTGGSRSYGSVKRGLIFAKDFTITNVGVKPLSNIAVSISGDADFSLVKPTVSQLNAGENVKFKVSFKPSSLGLKSAIVKIKSNDADENPFVINVSGTGISASSAARIALESVVKKSSSLVQEDGGTVTVRTTADGLSYLVLTIEKSSGLALGNRRVEVSGNLVDWYSGKKHTKVLVDDDSTLRVQDKTPVTPTKKRYIRLK